MKYIEDNSRFVIGKNKKGERTPIIENIKAIGNL